MPIVLKSGSLTILEPSGPLQACNGMLYLYLINNKICYRSRRECCAFNSFVSICEVM